MSTLFQKQVPNLIVFGFILIFGVAEFTDFGAYGYVGSIIFCISYVFFGNILIGSGKKVQYIIVSLVFIMYSTNKINRDVFGFDLFLFFLVAFASLFLKWPEKLRRDVI